VAAFDLDCDAAIGNGLAHRQAGLWSDGFPMRVAYFLALASIT
jgi:hypothetical protein